MYGCCHLGIFCTGGRTDDNMDLYPVIVLFLKPFLNRSAKILHLYLKKLSIDPFKFPCTTPTTELLNLYV